MPIYYFDVEDDGQIFADDEGTECADHKMVKTQAIKALAERSTRHSLTAITT
jgi:hypothetical protein